MEQRDTVPVSWGGCKRIADLAVGEHEVTVFTVNGGMVATHTLELHQVRARRGGAG
jgi:hypothetical protein